MAAILTKIQIARDTAANWAVSTRVLLSGEGGYATDTGVLKYGDGVSLWPALAAVNQVDAYIPVAAGATQALKAGKAYLVGNNSTLNFPAGAADGSVIVMAPSGGNWSSSGINFVGAGTDTVGQGQSISSAIDVATFVKSGTNWQVFIGGAGAVSASAIPPNVVRITASGSYTPTTGMKYAIVEMVGGGGGGGGTAATTGSQTAVGSGGGGAGGVKFMLSAAQLGAGPVAVTIGAGGGVTAGSSGGAGGTTTFGAFASAPGGNGGNFGSPYSTGDIKPAYPGTGGAAGTVTTGTLINATAGTNGTLGGLVGTVGNSISSGLGGSSALGANPNFGGGSSGGGGPAAPANTGAGGCGGYGGAGNVANPGGNGGSGLVIVHEFF